MLTYLVWVIIHLILKSQRNLCLKDGGILKILMHNPVINLPLSDLELEIAVKFIIEYVNSF